MKKHFKWIAVILLVACIFSFVGCPKEPLPIDTAAPAEVTNLSVTAADGNAVLSWTNPRDADFAGVQVSMNPAEGTLVNAVSLGKDVTCLKVSGLEIGSEYTFTVKTFDESLNYSEGVTAKATVADTSDKTAPADVTELTATASNGNAVLTWTNPADADFAGVQVAMTPAEGTLANAVSLGKDVTCLNVSGLKVGSEYTFTVKTFDTSLNYSDGVTAKATVADTSDKTAPADVTELTATASNGNAVLTWTNPADADFAGVQVAMTPAEGTLANAVSLGKDVTSLNVSGLKVGSEYTFTVKTFDTSLNYSDGATEKASVADTADYEAPADVTNLVATAADGNAVLIWTNPEDTDFAGVQVAMSPAEGTLANAVSLGKDVTSLNVSGLKVGSEYTFTVKTFDTSLNYSDGATEKASVADTADYEAPADVTNLVATNKDASVLLAWEDATDEDVYGYEVTWNKSNPINRSAAMTANSMMIAPGAEGCYISNLTNGTEYIFTVKSVDISGNKSEGVSKTITPSIIEKSPLVITLTPSTTEKTNQDVVISVEAITDNASEVKKITYKEGIFADIDDVLSGTDISTTKEITATENTTYTVAAVDTAGRRELAFITVSNIDKEAPAEVGNVTSLYSKLNNKMSIFWSNPVDTDFAGTIVSYGKIGSEDEVTIEVSKDKTSLEIEKNIADKGDYIIYIKTKDDVGNVGTSKIIESPLRMSSLVYYAGISTEWEQEELIENSFTFVARGDDEFKFTEGSWGYTAISNQIEALDTPIYLTKVGTLPIEDGNITFAKGLLDLEAKYKVILHVLNDAEAYLVVTEIEKAPEIPTKYTFTLHSKYGFYDENGTSIHDDNGNLITTRTEVFSYGSKFYEVYSQLSSNIFDSGFDENRQFQFYNERFIDENGKTQDVNSVKDKILTSDYTITLEFIDGVFITFDANGGTLWGMNEYIELLEKNKSIQGYIPEKPGYAFLGWTLTQDGDDFAEFFDKTSVTVYAKWSEIKSEWSEIKYEAEPGKLYLIPSRAWATGNEAYACWFWANGGNGFWELMTAKESDENNMEGLYEVTIPEGVDNVIFVAYDKTQEISWDAKFYQTRDLKIPTGDAVLYDVSRDSFVTPNNSGNSTVNETWTEIKTFKGLDGTWECTMEKKEVAEGIKIKGSSTIVIKIDGEKVSNKNTQIVDYTPMIETMAEELGKSSDEYWVEFKDEFVENKNWSFSYSEGKPYIITETHDWEEVDENDMFDEDTEVFVNNTKTKIKVNQSEPMYDEETWEPVLDENGNNVYEKVERILVKK